MAQKIIKDLSDLSTLQDLVLTENLVQATDEVIAPIPTPQKPTKQHLRVWLERQKGGKVSTIVRGWADSELALEALTKQLKQQLGVGGAVKNGEMLLQGDLREKVVALYAEKRAALKKAGDYEGLQKLPRKCGLGK